VNLIDEAGEGEETMKDRRGDVVGKIAVDADAAAGSNSGDIRFENVGGDHVEIGKFLREVAKAGDERGSISMAWTGAPVARRCWVISPCPEPISIQQC